MPRRHKNRKPKLEEHEQFWVDLWNSGYTPVCKGALFEDAHNHQETLGFLDPRMTEDMFCRNCMRHISRTNNQTHTEACNTFIHNMADDILHYINIEQRQCNLLPHAEIIWLNPCN